ncbi:hypothetical protein [Streptomyces sp. NPDC003943]
MKRRLVTAVAAGVPLAAALYLPTARADTENLAAQPLGCSTVTVQAPAGTHPGEGDHAKVKVWLPKDGWSGRLQTVGGSAFAAGAALPVRLLVPLLIRRPRRGKRERTG